MFKILQKNIRRLVQNGGYLTAFGFVQFRTGLKTEPSGPRRRQLCQQGRCQLIYGISRRSVVKMLVHLGSGRLFCRSTADVFPLRQRIFITFLPMRFPILFTRQRFLIALYQFFDMNRHHYSPKSFLRCNALSSFLRIPRYEVLILLSKPRR